MFTRPVLAQYVHDAETELHTDASKWGLSGILMQKQTNGLLQPVAYFSRQTKKEEQRYHSYELETLAVVSSLHRFRVFLIGIHFKILTDCSALRSTFAKRDLAPRIGRWWIQLQEYDCTIEYRPGSKMSHADALSRNAISDINNAKEIQDIGIFRIKHDDMLMVAQLQDRRLKYIREVLERQPKDGEEQLIKTQYVKKNERIYRKTEGRLKWAVPRGMRRNVTALCHDEMGHLGVDKTLHKLQQDYWFPAMRKCVKGYIMACVQCIFSKEPAGKKPGELNPIEKVPEPMHTLHMDHLGPFVKSTLGNTYLIVAVDAFTKYVFMKPVKSSKALPVERFTDEICMIFGFPSRIISDRGSAFTSKRFALFCRTHNIKHQLVAVATPRANEQADRYNLTNLDSPYASLNGENE